MNTASYRPIRLTFFTVAIIFFLLLGYIAFSPLAIVSKASGTSLSLRIRTQGTHRDGHIIKARVQLYDGPQKAIEETQAILTFTHDAYESTVLLQSGFSFSNPYALYIKPDKHTGRIFCNTELAGTACVTPLFRLLERANNIDLSKYIFLAGDTPPANGKVDAADISFIMKQLGKTGDNAPTDVNTDGITDVTDYSLALYSLAQNARDEEVKLTSPTPSPSLQPTASPTPKATIPPTVLPTPTITPTVTPTPTLTPPSPTPTPTSLPRYGKNCVNGAAKVTKPLNPQWQLNVLPVPYGRDQYTCVNASNIVLHWSDSPNFLGNSATWGALNGRNRMCGLAVDSKETLQMSNFYDDKVTWEGCSTLDDAINIEINGTMFDLWYSNDCKIVNPARNPALSKGELQKAKETIASQYSVDPSVMDWENERYVSIMEAQEKRVLDTVRYLQLFYKIPPEKITGHFKLTSGKTDPGPRFLECIKKKI
jgi:hypothetical protein